MAGALAGVCLGGFPTAQAAGRTESLAGEKAAERLRRDEIPRHHNITAGPVAFAISARLTTEYTDNARYSETQRSDDFIIRPSVRVGAHWPITELNALDLNLGVSYAYYLDNHDLNPNAPLISPGSELSLLFFVGNFRIRLFDRFSVQESLGYDRDVITGISDVRLFTRISNTAGITADWDLNALVLTASFEHENFLSPQERYQYLDRASEKLALTGTVYATPAVRTGIESRGSWNDYDRDQLTDHWRAAIGPFAAVTLSPYINFRVGVGYDAVRYVSPPDELKDVHDVSAYLRASHRVNPFLTYSLSVARENQTGYSAANRQTTYGQITLDWEVLRHVDLSTYLAGGVVDETSSATQYEFTYFRIGLDLGWRFARRYTALLGYDFLTQSSDREGRSYDQNRIRTGVEYRF